MKTYLLPFFFMLSSCTYNFRGSLPSNIKTIFIDSFRDKKTEGRSLGLRFTNTLNQAFIDDNTLLNISKDKADLQLRGNIEAITREATKINLSNQPTASSYKLTVIVSINCKNMSTKKNLVNARISRVAQINATLTDNEIEEKIIILLDEIKNIIVDRVIGAW